MDPVEATIERGKTLTVPYHLRSRLTGSKVLFAGQHHRRQCAYRSQYPQRRARLTCSFVPEA
jgi:hypothetical protein